MNYYNYIEKGNPYVILKELYIYLIAKYNIPNDYCRILYDDTMNVQSIRNGFINWTVYLQEDIDVSIYIDNKIVLHNDGLFDLSEKGIIDDIKTFFKYKNRKHTLDELL